MYYDHFGEGVINSFDRMGSFGLTTIIGDPAGLVSPDQSPRFSSLYNIPSTYNGCAADIHLPDSAGSVASGAHRRLSVFSAVHPGNRWGVHQLGNGQWIKNALFARV